MANLNEVTVTAKRPLNNPDVNSTYIIKSGDNLSTIAKKYNIDISTLLKLNPLVKNLNTIFSGEIIKIPSTYQKKPSNNYIVKSGDNLSKIAANNNITILDILKSNPGINPNIIRPGQLIKLIAKNIYTPLERNWKDILNYENSLNRLLGADLINTYYKNKPTGTPYIIDDKKAGKLSVYIDGKLIRSFNAIHGANGRATAAQKAKWKQLNFAEVDDYTKTYVDKNGKIRNGEGNMSTPAGIFYTDPSGTYHGAPLFMRRDSDMLKSNNPNGIASSIHYRDMSRSKVTNGCTGMSALDLKSLSNILKGYKHTPTYILPDNPNNSKFFVRNGVLNFTGNRRTMLLNGVSKGFRGNINIKFDGIDNNGNSYGKDRISITNNYILGLTKYKRLLMLDLGINDDTYNNLALASLGILGRETSYGNKHSVLGNFGRAVNKFFNRNSASSPDYESKYSTYGATGDNNSIGLTLMRISQLDSNSLKLMKKYGITKNDLVYNPSKAAIATMIKLSLEYKNLGLNIDKAISSWNNRPGYLNSVKQLVNNDFNLYTSYKKGGKLSSKKLLPKHLTGGKTLPAATSIFVSNIGSKMINMYSALRQKGIPEQAAFDTTWQSLKELPKGYYAFGRPSKDIDQWATRSNYSLTKGLYKVAKDSTNYNTFIDPVLHKGYNKKPGYKTWLLNGRLNAVDYLNLYLKLNNIPDKPIVLINNNDNNNV